MKRTTLKRGRTKPTYDARAWREGLGPCVVCEDRGVDSTRTPRDPHHVIFAQHLRKRGHHDLLGDHRNRISLCRYHHENFHAGRRIPRRLIPQEAVEFAEELGLGHLIDRFYGTQESCQSEEAKPFASAESRLSNEKGPVACG